MTATVLEVNPESTGSFLQEVTRRSGQMLTACYQCRRCAAGCTVGDETGAFTPNLLIRAIVLGDVKTALNNPLVWKCVSCYTCGTRCPNDIQTARITETLKQMAKEAKLPPLSPKVADFHDAFVASGVRWGRVNEMEFVGAYEMKSSLRSAWKRDFEAIFEELKAQGKLGFALFRRRRMHMGFQMAKGRKEIRALYKIAKKKKTAGRSAATGMNR